MPVIEYNTPGFLVSYYVFDGVYTTVWKTFRLPDTLPHLRHDIFDHVYHSVDRETSVSCPAQSCEPVSATKFVVLHFRGSDKNATLAEFNTTEVLSRIPRPETTKKVPQMARRPCTTKTQFSVKK
jgi:hypothetical protein